MSDAFIECPNCERCHPQSDPCASRKSTAPEPPRDMPWRVSKGWIDAARVSIWNVHGEIVASSVRPEDAERIVTAINQQAEMELIDIGVGITPVLVPTRSVQVINSVLMDLRKQLGDALREKEEKK